VRLTYRPHATYPDTFEVCQGGATLGRVWSYRDVSRRINGLSWAYTRYGEKPVCEPGFSSRTEAAQALVQRR
jgi:hypothetical protein